MIVLVFLGMGLLNWVSYYAQIRAEAVLGQSILLNLRSQLFDHLQRLSVRFFSHNEVGRIMSRVQNDVGELGDFLDSGAFWVIGEVVSMVGIIVVLFTMESEAGVAYPGGGTAALSVHRVLARESTPILYQGQAGYLLGQWCS